MQIKYNHALAKRREQRAESELSTLLDKMSLRGDALERKILKTLDSLPAMPQIVMKARDILRDPQVNFKEFERTLEADQAIAAKVLRVANSAYYGMSGKISSIKRASVLLGCKTIAELVFLTGTSGFLGKELKGYGMESGEMWRHSMAVAFGAKKIAIRKREQFSDDAFTAGLIHDVGKLILNSYILDRKTVFDKYIKNNDQNLLNAERKLLGLDHAKIAAKVCEKWNFPETIYTAIGYHHDPDKFKTNELACIINVADEIAKWYEKDKEMMLIDINKTARKVLDINPDEMRQTLSEVTRYVDQIVEQMSGV